MEHLIQMLIGCLVITIFTTTAHAKIGSMQIGDNLPANTDAHQCRELCLQKFERALEPCKNEIVCSKCISSCSLLTRQNKKLQKNSWPLRIATMIKQEFLVLTHLAWEPSDYLTNCLVTWEVYGGGLMGTLLTDSSNVELSLWPETRYRVQVTCKDKTTSEYVKSLPLVINTSDAIPMKPESPKDDEQQGNESSPSGQSGIKLSTPIIPKTTMKLENTIEKDQNSYSKYSSPQLLGIYNNMKEIVLGACAALIVFLFILTLFCAYRGRDYHHYKGDYAREILVTVES